jgi:hypothetical protein
MSTSTTLRTSSRVGVLATVVLAVSGAAFAQTDPKPGFNLFSVEQDIEIGRQSAAQAERQLPLLRDASVERYLNAVARRLVDEAPGHRYPYQVKAVDASEINAFASREASCISTPAWSRPPAAKASSRVSSPTRSPTWPCGTARIRRQPAAQASWDPRWLLGRGENRGRIVRPVAASG